MGPNLATLKAIRDDLTSFLVLMQVVFISTLLVLSVFVSHRIAGPLYKLKKFMEGAKDGDLSEELGFRKADYFHELSGSYNGLRETLLKDRARLAEAIDYLEKGEKDPALKILKTLPH